MSTNDILIFAFIQPLPSWAAVRTGPYPILSCFLFGQQGSLAIWFLCYLCIYVPAFALFLSWSLWILYVLQLMIV